MAKISKTFVVKKGRRFSAFRKSFVEMGRIYIQYIVSYFVQQRHFTAASSIQQDGFSPDRIPALHKVLDPDLTLVADPDPYVFGPPGSGSVS